MARRILLFCVVTLAIINSAAIGEYPINLATSAAMKGGGDAVEISADISGVDALELIATGYSWGQAAWAAPVLIDESGNETKLVDLQPATFTVGWGTFSINKGPDGKKLKIADRQFAHGLFAHADSRVVYSLEGKYKQFKSWIGINHTAGKQGTVIFELRDGGNYQLQLRYKKIKDGFCKSALAEIRGILKNSGAGEKQLKRLAYFESCFDKTLAGLEAESEDAMGIAEKFVEFARGIYLSSLDAPLLFVKRNEYMAGHIYDDYLTWHPGGGIYIIENPAAPIDEQIVRALIDPQTPETLGFGVYRDPDISYDGKRVLFAFKDGPEGNTNIYEIGIDGKGLRQISDPGGDCSDMKPQAGLIGKGHHDIAPCYLPDGRVTYTSTRTGGHVMCFSSYIDTLHTMNADGSDIKSISINNQNEFDPSILPDGRILYGRWEYVDKTALYMQSLWTVNPDGTQETAFFANNMAKPTAVLDARAVPGSSLIVASLTPHNGQPVGAIAMIDSKIGKNNLNSITNFTPEYPTEMDQGLTRGPCDPWPLSKDVILIANNDPKQGKHGVIELITRGGFRTVIRSENDITCYSPMLVKPRPIPPVRPSLIKPGKPGTFMVHDLYEGMDGVKRGTIKWLRVLETTSRVSGIPAGGRWWNQAFLASWQGSYDIKKFLGVVPVEPDGSVFFEAPLAKAIYFQALDAKGRMIQSQRTFVQSIAGVTRSCTGCHVKEDNTTAVNRGRIDEAIGKTPAKLQAESWGTGFVDYATMIQPILDRRCVSCHGGEKGIAAGIDLTGGWTWAFNISYETLIKNTLTGFLNCNNMSVRTAEILDPLTHGSGAAPLTKLLLSGHDGMIRDITKTEIDLLMAWMDGNCNYYGTWDYTKYPVCNDINSAGTKLTAQMQKAGCTNCHEKAVGNDWINLESPQNSRILRAPLAKITNKLGLSWCRNRKARPLDYKLIGQHYQPPDVFKPKKRKAPNLNGKAVIIFADTNNKTYQAMLNIIKQTQTAALQKPRVDMPGAEIIPGKCRDLEPLSPPVIASNSTLDR